MVAPTELSIIDTNGKQVSKQVLPTQALEQKVKPTLVHQVVVAYEANRRAGTAHTKTRAEVSGGGRKPWRQKGTGRARHGSIRSPLWVGGGVTFGPRSSRNYQQKINKSVKEQALKMVVADRLKRGKVTVCQSYPSELKTKVIASWLKKLNLDGRKLLVVLDDAERGQVRAWKNLPNVELMALRHVNPYDLVKKSHWFMSEAVLQNLLSKLFKS